jgi:unsaturated rhamnogalacturonyl hydrolase
VAASRVLGEDRWLRFAQGWFRAWATRAQPYRRLDCTAPGLAMVQVYEATGDSRVLEAAVGLAGYLRSRPRLDGVFETWESSPADAPVRPAAARRRRGPAARRPAPRCLRGLPALRPAVPHRPRPGPRRRALVDEGVAQALGYVRLLQRPDGCSSTSCCPARRGRTARLGSRPGLGAARPARRRRPPARRATPAGTSCCRQLGRLVTAMVAPAAPDGSWPVVVTDAGSGDEDSTAAFMAHGFARACGAVRSRRWTSATPRRGRCVPPWPA